MNGNNKITVLSGIRATGKLHLGNYLGALVRFAEMSRNPEYRCLFFVADLHTLTTLKDGAAIAGSVPEIILDYLAAGVDPGSSVIYAQSHVPQVTELMWYLNCLTPVADVLNVGAYKDKAAKNPDDNNVGLLTYPVLMAADILGPRANLVPVGKDQEQHLELAADLARRFNRLYGEYFPVPDCLRQEMILIPGLSLKDFERDSFSKMGKSDNNTINLEDTAVETTRKIAVSPTDPKRARRTDPGNPGDCAIFALHQSVSSGEQIRLVQEGCSTAGIGCMECKSVLSTNVNELLAEFRSRRAELAGRRDLVRDVLAAGSKVASALFDETLDHVRTSMGVGYGGSTS